VIAEVYFQYPSPPVLPKLTATPGDGKVVLSWDDAALVETREPFNGNVNDFEGYKLYRSKTIDMADVVLVEGAWSKPYMRQPLFQCDRIDGKKDYTYYGIEEGLGYYLGNDTRIKNYFVDSTVSNGVTYFYVLTAYDYGIPDVGKGFAPLENDYSYETDADGNITSLSKNAVMAIPHPASTNYISPKAEASAKNTVGTTDVEIEILDPSKVKAGHTYKIKFLVDSISNLRATQQIRHKNDILYTNKGFVIYDMNRNDSLVYMESPQSFSDNNILSNVHIIAGNIFREYRYLNPAGIQSNIFNGIRIRFNNLPKVFAAFDSSHSGWLFGNAAIGITVNPAESVYFPWQYDLIFHDEAYIFKSRTSEKKYIRSADGQPLVSTSLLLGQSFNFEVVNKSFADKDGNYEQLDLIVHDVNRNGMFDPDSDYVLAGHAVDYNGRIYWAGTVFGIDFHSIHFMDKMPASGDVYRVDFQRPFVETDSVIFTVSQGQINDSQYAKVELSDIAVVPNPYLITNEMETSGEKFLKKLMFTHLPSQCTISIFTISGAFVHEIAVNNPLDNGTIFWDLKSSRGQDVAPGYYIYHVKSTISGSEKTGKFAILR
jgi:hypothetical protein